MPLSDDDVRALAVAAVEDEPVESLFARNGDRWRVRLPNELFLRVVVDAALTNAVAYMRGQRDIVYDQGTRDYWGMRINGHCAECALCVALGRPWVPATYDRRHNGDVGRVEVRSTANPDLGLRLRDRDHADRPYVAALGSGNEWTFRGWVMGRDGMVPAYRRYSDNWIVPFADLRPMDELPREFYE